MRWLIYTLILVNALFLYWNIEHQRDLDQRPPPVSHAAEITQLILIEELGTDELRERREEPAEPEPSNDASTNLASAVPDSTAQFPRIALVCYSVGPLADESMREPLKAWLVAAGAHAELREDERRELSRYWVHVPPLADGEAARKLLASMRAKGLVDLHVIRRGNMANAISLGVYSRKSGLERRMAQLTKLGFDAQVRESYKTHKASWFDVVIPADSAFDEERLSAQFAKVESRKRACAQASPQT